jgi:2,3-bisphosphoglycerate-dependent phosphoglycerate mutase
MPIPTPREDSNTAARSASTSLILVRHGETAWNRERRIQGQLDTPLNDEGRRQAIAAGTRLAAERSRYGLDCAAGARIVSSDLLRCRETAEAIAAATGLPITTDSRLRERGYGMFEGRTYPEVQRDMAEAFQRWLSRDPDFDVDGGESLRTFQQRVVAVLDELARAAPGATLVVVTHGGVLDIACRLCRDLGLTVPRDYELLNASLNRICWDGSRFSIVDWGDVSHWQPALDDSVPGDPVQSSLSA